MGPVAQSGKFLKMQKGGKFLKVLREDKYLFCRLQIRL
jgi:hypothetical protein